MIFSPTTFALCTSLIILAVFSPSTFAAETSPMPVHQRINVAHRGASHLAPENTLIAYRIAISAGADGAECDIYASADGVPFLSHDRTAKRTMGGEDRDVTTMRFDEIRQLDAGAWKGKQFKGEKVPTLDEFLELLQGTPCHPVIELKMEGIEQPVLDVIRKRGMIEVSTIIAFSQKVVKEIRRLESNICVAFLYSENLKGETAEEAADRLDAFLRDRSRDLGTNVLDLNHGILSKTLVEKLNAADIHVWAWTVNDTDRMNTLLDWGVVSITTDRPELLTELLKKRKKGK